MSEENNSLLIPVMVATLAGGGASHIGTRMTMDEGQAVNSSTIQDCSNFVSHERRHALDECALRVLECQLKK